MHLTIEIKTNAYRYLWLRHVRGFDASRHCAKCLLGDYNPLFPYGAKQAGDRFSGDIDPNAAPYHYLCGVTSKWMENLHLAFQYAPGKTISYEDKHCKVTITDAEQLAIRPLPDALIAAKNLAAAFFTCRNYQFGWQTFGGEMKGNARI